MLSPYLNVEELQDNIKAFDIQNCAIRISITFSAPSANSELSFSMRYHNRSVSIKTGTSRG